MSKRSRLMMQGLGHAPLQPPKVNLKPKRAKSEKTEDYDSDGSASSFTPSESGVLNQDFKGGKKCLKEGDRMAKPESALPNLVNYSPSSSVASIASHISNKDDKENSPTQAKSIFATVKSRAHQNILSDLQLNGISERSVSPVMPEIVKMKTKPPTLSCSSNSDGAKEPLSDINITEKITSNTRRSLLPDFDKQPDGKYLSHARNIVDRNTNIPMKPKLIGSKNEQRQLPLRIGLPKPSQVDRITKNNGDCSLETPKLSAYQMLKQKNCKQNEEMLQSLGVSIYPEATSNEVVKSKKSAELPTSSLLPTKKKTDTKKLPSRQSRTVAREHIRAGVSDCSSQSDQSSDDDSSDSMTDMSSDSSDDDDHNNRSKSAQKPQHGMGKNTKEQTRPLSEIEDDPNESSESSPLKGPDHTTSNPGHRWLYSESEEIEADDQRENFISDAEIEEEAGSHNESQDESDEGTPSAKITRTAKRAQQKELRNSGKRHITGRGRVVAGRRRKPPHTCTVRKCHEIITPEAGAEIFREYWLQASHDKRVAYVATRIEKQEIKRKRSRKDIENREKNQACKYYLEIEGTRYSVCRSTFLNTLGETDRFVRTVVDNKSLSFSGITHDDKRGKKTPPHALSLTNKAEAVQRHIRSYPAYVSHYCRAKSGETKYLNSNLSVAEMYRQYTEDKDNPTISLSAYTNQFNLTGLKIHRQQTDGCDKCDTMHITINQSPSGSAERKALTEKKELHLRKAEKAYELKREAKLEAKTDPKKKVLVCDMQQCLPTPYLKCKKIYFSRQLYVLNYTVNDCSTNLTHNYMWTENEGHRGGNEVASCLLKHILENVGDDVEELTIFSDCCSGQNRNYIMCMMFFIALQEHPSLRKIDHILLVPGHTFMPEVDTKHAAIEKHYKKYVERINVPEEWYPIVEKAGQGKFLVHHMEEFKDIGALAKKELVRRALCTDKAPVHYMKTHWWRYERESIGMVSVKASFNEAAAFRTLSFLRRGVRSDRVQRLSDSLQVLPGNVPVSEEKKEDLMKLLPYLDEQFHKYYQDIPSSANVPNYTA